MNKTELLADLEAKSLKVVSTVEEPDAVKNAADVKCYITHVMEQNGDKVTGRNIGFYVIDEGQPTEEAYVRDVITDKNVVRDAALTYLEGLVPATYIRTELKGRVDEASKYAFADAYKDNGDGTCTRVQLIVFKDGASPIEHREITA